MALPAILAAIAPKILDVVDKAVPDKDASAHLKAALAAQILNNESEITKAAASVVAAEAQGESWLQRNWRPLLMMWFSFLLGSYWFGYAPVNMPIEIIDRLFDIIYLSVGGYVVGRSGEKIISTLAPQIKHLKGP